MKTLKLLLATAAVATIMLAFRDLRTGEWLRPALEGREPGMRGEDAEPVLGYDGMDVETLLDWLDDADLDDDTLLEIEAYERENRNRRTVLNALAELLGRELPA
jgi:hypothetical protein